MQTGPNLPLVHLLHHLTLYLHSHIIDFYPSSITFFLLPRTPVCICLYCLHPPEICSFHLYLWKHYPLSNALLKFHLFHKALPDLSLNHYHNHLIVDGLVICVTEVSTHVYLSHPNVNLWEWGETAWYIFRHFTLQYYVLHCLVPYKHLMNWTDFYHDKSSEGGKKKCQ